MIPIDPDREQRETAPHVYLGRVAGDPEDSSRTPAHALGARAVWLRHTAFQLFHASFVLSERVEGEREIPIGVRGKLWLIGRRVARHVSRAETADSG